MAADKLRELGLVGRRPSASSFVADCRLRGSDTRCSELGATVVHTQRTHATIGVESHIELTWVRVGRSLTWDHPPASACRERLFVAASAAQ
eukprot:5143288-Prymnesium_polylepis.1